MPITLSTPYNPGDADPGQQYPLAKITSVIFALTENPQIYMRFDVRYGNVDENGKWKDGAATRSLPVIISGEELDTIRGEICQPGETAYQAVARVLYQYLLDKNIVEGTIEPSIPHLP